MIAESFRPAGMTRAGRRPIHAMLVHFPLVCFTGALATDLVYWASDDIMWQIFSTWLITAGIAMGALAMLAGLADLFGDRRVRSQRGAFVHAFGNLGALGLAVVNALIHSRDGYTSVVPQGIALSALVVLILVGTSLIGRRLADRVLLQGAR